jgi:cytochrome c oxidase subunit III
MSAQALAENDPPSPLTAELGMWVFLATEILFFGVLFVAYLITRIHHPQAFAMASRLTDLRLGSINTAVLLTSSLTMVLGARAARERRWRPCASWLTATAALGVVFLVLKGMEYYSDFDRHLVPGVGFALSGPDRRGLEQFFLAYFVTTGAHATHLLIGIGLVAFLALRARSGRNHPSPNSVEVGALYWHLVDVVWIFLFPLLYLVSRA